MIQVIASIYLVVTYVAGISISIYAERYRKMLRKQRVEYRQRVELQKAVNAYNRRVKRFMEEVNET